MSKSERLSKWKRKNELLTKWMESPDFKEVYTSRNTENCKWCYRFGILDYLHCLNCGKKIRGRLAK